jgi:hypothetical protein
MDIGPNEFGLGGRGTDYYSTVGTFSLRVESGCTWEITVSPYGGGPGGPYQTFTSAQTGSNGNTLQFGEPGPWQMAWSFSCARFDFPGVFGVNINQPVGDFVHDIGPNELGRIGSGVRRYGDKGTISLGVESNCS